MGQQFCFFNYSIGNKFRFHYNYSGCCGLHYHSDPPNKYSQIAKYPFAHSAKHSCIYLYVCVCVHVCACV